MKLTIDQMLDAVIRKYGFENPKTVNFAKLCEKNPKNAPNRFTALMGHMA